MGVKVVEKLFVECENKSRCEIAENNAQCRQLRDGLLDLVGINFRICGLSIETGHPGDVSDVGYVPFEGSPEAAISGGAAARELVAIV